MKDLSEAKKIFFESLASSVAIDRNYGNKYRKFHVPKEIEKEWKEEILKMLLNRISIQKGSDRIDSVFAYIDIIDVDTAVVFLSNFLKENILDTFSSIIVLETLKRYLSHAKTYSLSSDLIKKKKKIIDSYKDKLLTSKITIDNSYKANRYMKDYDFSDENIIRRINEI